MGSLANLLVRTLLNVTVKVNNIVVKYAVPTVMATLTCDSLQVKTGDDLQLGGLQVTTLFNGRERMFVMLMPTYCTQQTVPF